ncbi:MAG: hypothetical protein COX19_17735 [Desulfobacterales bacterium CG23_combo_of_CG06-09_8_20_14_all_51_8]|nr:MAG: hypothetical protein COX19_17735 [Desulfobacterales bacterium CG23_combo_of_CG06-09_8_20_14_all_51_8]
MFEIDDPRFLAGTIFLMAEIFPHQSLESAGVALRAVWRVDPLEDKSGAFVADNTAGTYLSGFTAKSYFLTNCGRPSTPVSDTGRDLDPVSFEKGALKSGAPVSTVGPSDSTSPSPGSKTIVIESAPETRTICFQGFPDPVSRDIYPVLSQMPGLQSIRRRDDACGPDSGTVGYVLQCRCRTESLADWLEANLRTSGNRVVPFRIHTGGNNIVNVNYDGGF